MRLETLYQDYPPSSRTDLFLALIAVILLFFGLIMIISSSTVIGFRVYHDTFYFVKRHAIYLIVGLGPLFGGLMIPHFFWRKYAFHLWIGSLLLVGLTYIPHIGSTAGGAARWISLAGFRFQPSDVLKFTMILLLADHLDRHKGHLHNISRSIIPVFVIMAVSILIVLNQPDLGTSVVLASSSMVLLFISGFPMLLFIGLIPVGLGVVAYSIMKTPYQLRRIAAFLDPWSDPLGKGFHTIQSLIAVGSGGLLGLGIGQSRQKFFFLPQQYTDYIFSIIGEEFGFIATSLFLLVYFLFIYRSFWIAVRVEQLYSKLLCSGLIFWISIQALINIGVAINLVPSKGITLPFISFGGTSLIMVMFIAGILLNISRYRVPRT
ncbi:MAG: putative lipid II flippase FtsW [Candidatus Margulisiibacteriota bacterium]